MAYTGRHRRPARAVTRRARQRIVYERLFDSGSITNNAAATKTAILANLETRLGNEIWGATVLKMWGTMSMAVSAGVTSPGWLFMGSMVAKGELLDLATGHPDPDYVSTNNDKYATWGGLSYFATPVSANTTQPVTYRWVHSRRQRISQPDDTFLMAYKFNFGQAASTVNFQTIINIAVALP